MVYKPAFTSLGGPILWECLWIRKNCRISQWSPFSFFGLSRSIMQELLQITPFLRDELRYTDLQYIIWLVVDLPLWKIWVRQLGWWNSQYMEKWSKCSKPPTSTVYNHFESFEKGNGGIFCLDQQAIRISTSHPAELQIKKDLSNIYRPRCLFCYVLTIQLLGFMLTLSFQNAIVLPSSKLTVCELEHDP